MSDPTKIDFPEDCIRIQEVAKSNGIKLSILASRDLWEAHSATYYAGWLFLPDQDRDLWETLRIYIDPNEKNKFAQ